jgi:uncharacterized protein YgiM (DUF1202 family)
MANEKRLVIGVLAAIAALTFALGTAWRTSAGTDRSGELRATLGPDSATFTRAQPAPPLGDDPVRLQTTPQLTTMPGAVDSTPTPIPPTLLPTPLPTNTPGPSPTPPPTYTPQPPTPAALPPLELAAVVNAPDGLIVRGGPARTYPLQAILLNGAQVTVFQRTINNEWVRVRGPQVDGWVFAQYLVIEGDLNRVVVQNVAPPATATAAAVASTTNNCISVVGDSIAYGEVIFEIPATGFMHVKMAPFAFYVQEQLRSRGIGLSVTDRSYPGIGITSPRHKKYWEIPVWQDFVGDRCRFTVVLPWVNDLSSGIDPIQSAPMHIGNMVGFAQALLRNNPDGQILFVNYYPGAPAGFALAMAPGFTPVAIQMFNDAMRLACGDGGPLKAIPQVTCVDSLSAFAQLGNSYVVGPMTRPEIATFNTKPLSPDEQKMFDYYTSLNPDGLLIGDGIHLSSVGKTALASYIVDIITKLPAFTQP